MPEHLFFCLLIIPILGRLFHTGQLCPGIVQLSVHGPGTVLPFSEEIRITHVIGVGPGIIRQNRKGQLLFRRAFAEAKGSRQGYRLSLAVIAGTDNPAAVGYYIPVAGLPRDLRPVNPLSPAGSGWT